MKITNFSTKGKYPDFLGIGSQRSGSTWLHHVFSLHPDIWITPVKELHYFDKPMKGMTTYFSDPLKYSREFLSLIIKKRKMNHDSLLRNTRWGINYFFRKRSENWYKNLFLHADNRLAGEITPAYAILDRDSINHIFSNNNNIRAIYLLRNPIDRGWSSIVNNLAKKRGIPITQVPKEKILNRIQSKAFLERSNYAENIRRWTSVIGTKQLFIGYFEDIVSQPDVLMNRICQFLGIDSYPFENRNDLWKSKNTTKKYSAPIPKEIERILAKKLYPMIKDMHEMLGGYTNKWLSGAEKILRKNQ